MSTQVVVETVRVSADARGLVLEPIGREVIAGQQNVHLALTAPGGVRGNHYHRHGTEIAVILGPALARYWEEDVTREVQVPAGQAFRFIIPPGVAHAFQNTGSGLMLLAGFNTEPHDPSNPDTVREVLIGS